MAQMANAPRNPTIGPTMTPVLLECELPAEALGVPSIEVGALESVTVELLRI